MTRFCTKCGKALAEGEMCSCQDNNILSSLKSFIREGIPANSENNSFLERGQKIVPDSIRADESEIPIKQYRFARLRSRFRGQYAEGRLQVTNKRLLFRAAGISALGKTIIQQEFAVSEIAGVEIKKSNRVSIMNALLCLILTLFISSWAEGIFDTWSKSAAGLTSFLAYILPIGCFSLLIFCKKLHWLKLFAFAIGIGALLGASTQTLNPIDIVFGFELFSVTNILIFVLSIGWVYTLLRVCFVPDLIFSVKTKSSSDVIELRRRVWGAFLKNPQENSGFSEVMPWDDTEKVAEELGALINDLQTLGDMAVDTWKE